MKGNEQLADVAATTRRAPRDRLPALLDVVQSISGLALVMFLGMHLLLDAAILIGPSAADAVARAFEGQYLFGTAHPWIVSLAALALLTLIVVHAVLALRKLPHSTREYVAFRHHLRGINHGDTRLWWWQVVTGMALFFLIAPHLYIVITQPETIGASASAHRVVAERAWVLYAILLPVVLLHAAAGTYRMVVKWGWPKLSRVRLRPWVWGIAGAYCVLGLAALVAYTILGLRLTE
jgi:fumarate reductase subunit C